LDVAECEGKRSLLAQTAALEHDFQDQQEAARERRALPFWRRWFTPAPD